jgi:hypothetical protein
MVDVDSSLPPEVPQLGRWWTSLGDSIGSRWDAGGRDPADFPETAATVLAECTPPTDLAVASLSWLAEAALPHQHDLGSGFGQPAVTVYRADDFIVYLLFWFDESTLIHDHRFSGAFTILEGKSLQNVYRFESPEQLAPEIQGGVLRCTKVEILSAGDVRLIPSGPALIHSNVHFGSPPTLSLVARTLVSARDPQRSYAQSGLAWVNGERSPATTMRLQGFAASCRISPEAGAEFLRRVLVRAQPMEILDFVATAVRYLGSSLYLDPLIAASCLGASETARQQVTGYARQLVVGFQALNELHAVVDSEDRLLLSMVAAGTDWEMASDALHQAIPHMDPRRALCHLVAGLLQRLAAARRPSACALSESARDFVTNRATGATGTPTDAVYTELLTHRVFGSLFTFVLEDETTA